MKRVLLFLPPDEKHPDKRYPNGRYYAVTNAAFLIGNDPGSDLGLRSKPISQLARLDRAADGSYALYVLQMPAPVMITVNGEEVVRRRDLKHGDLIEIDNRQLDYREEEVSNPALERDRLGCEFCLRTLNPHDSDSIDRSAVFVAGKLYHEHCWKVSPVRTVDAVPLLLQRPVPLVPGTIMPAPVQVDHENSLYDAPLGVEAPSVALEHQKLRRFTVRNNVDYDLELDRRNMPAWAYIDYGPPYGPDLFLQLAPTKECEITVHPNCVRPAKGTYRLALGAHQSINIQSKGDALVWPAALFVFCMLYLFYGVTLWGLYLQVPDSGDLSQIHLPAILWPLCPLMPLLGALWYLAPAKIILGVCTFIDGLQQIRVLTKHFASDLNGRMLAMARAWLDHWLWPFFAFCWGVLLAMLILGILALTFLLGSAALNILATVAAFLAPLVFVYWVAK